MNISCAADMHGHLQEEIMAAVESGEVGDLADLGVESLPTVMGLADGASPAGAAESGGSASDGGGRAAPLAWRFLPISH
jgi:hypothetical protein